MTLNAILHFAGVIVCVGVGWYGFSREPRSFINRVFTLGMVLLALESLFTGLSVRGGLPENVMLWQSWRFRVAALLPGIWLVFTLSFPSENYKNVLSKWKWVVISVFLGHLLLVTVLTRNFFEVLPSSEAIERWLLPLSWAGHAFFLLFLLSAVLIVALLERTLRNVRGRQHWQVKFLVIGLGTIFAARLYTGSQALLFHTVNLELEVINAVALLAASPLIFISISRTRGLRTDLYLSHTAIYSSLTVILAGVYFLAVGIFAKLVEYVNGGTSLTLGALIIFLAIPGLLIIFLSERLRRKIKLIIGRHFRRPHFDYRKVWTDFTQQTASLMQMNDLADKAAKMISHTLDLHSVSIWLADETQLGLKLAASTVLSQNRLRQIPKLNEATSSLACFMCDQKQLVDSRGKWYEELSQTHPEFLEQARIQSCISLEAGGNFLGLMTFDELAKGKPFSLEEKDLIKTMADQVATSLLHLKLSKRLQQAKEMEVFQTVGAFFVHDLKNLASQLSMMFENLPRHFDNPNFRKDALDLLSHSVVRIDTICCRISSFRDRLEINPVETDLNEVVRATVHQFNGLSNHILTEELQPLPKLHLDTEQIQNVLTNLVMNARDSLCDGGTIQVTTDRRDGWVELSVRDSGCGMSREFMENGLFRPFKTTKKRGVGIGLYQSKMIVEAHKGRIEVESQEGVGSTFRVLLPIDSKSA
jgi:putative PEP-CTERM system histidine kinase